MTEADQVKIRLEAATLFYGRVQAVRDVSLEIRERRVTAIIGPSGCGKSSLLKLMNRMAERAVRARIEGRILLDGLDIYGEDADPVEIRRRVGMVFQQPNPFPKSIFDNVAYGPRIHGLTDRNRLAGIVERSLKEAALWGEVSDRLHESALTLSGGQQQRLCIARALAVEPEVLLMDEPCSALDPASTLRIEELARDLSDQYTIIIVTHNMQQAARVSSQTAFMLNGDLVEYGPTKEMFTRPRDQRTEDYITGRFG